MNYNWNPYAFPDWQKQTNESHYPHMSRAISIVDAINIALQRVPGEAVEAELERRQGKQLYEVDIKAQDGARYEVEVDRETGEIISVELD